MTRHIFEHHMSAPQHVTCLSHNAYVSLSNMLVVDPVPLMHGGRHAYATI